MAYPSPGCHATRRASWARPCLVAAAVMALLPLPAFAGEGSDSLRPGAWAAEFEIDPTTHGGIGYVGSATLAVKHHSSPTRALRFGVNVGFRETEGDGALEQFTYDAVVQPIPTRSTMPFDQHSESHDYAVLLHFVRERSAADRVSMFVETGPSFHYSESKYRRESIYGPSQVRSAYDSEELSRAVALDLALGFEWFYSKRLSLGARYGASVDYSWGFETFISESGNVDGSSLSMDRDHRVLKGVDVATTRATVTLAAYF